MIIQVSIKNQILSRLNELRSKEGMEKLIANFRKTKTSKDSDDVIEKAINISN